MGHISFLKTDPINKDENKPPVSLTFVNEVSLCAYMI